MWVSTIRGEVQFPQSVGGGWEPMTRQPSPLWRQDQSPPGAGLTPIPSSPSPAPCCWVPSLLPAAAVGCGGGASGNNPWWHKTPRQTPPSERYADSTVSWPRRMRRGFFIGPVLVSLGDGGADEKGSRLAALAGFPDQPERAPSVTGRTPGRPVYSSSKGLMLASSRHQSDRQFVLLRCPTCLGFRPRTLPEQMGEAI